MGLAGNWSWLGEDIDKLKALREITKDDEQIKVLDEVIASLENKKGE